jgi:prepilin-type N-terminal cleavage/methylation domain-containing protein
MLPVLNLPMTRTHHIRTSSRGFSLIELMVSISLFTIVVTIAMSAYVSLIAIDRTARATNELVSNLSYAVNAMSRSIRTGTYYTQSVTGTGNSNQFSFIDENCRYVQYLLKSGSIGVCMSNADTSGACNPTQPVCNATTASSITDSRTQITSMRFLLQPTLPTVPAGSQPRVLISITGNIDGGAGTPINFTIQTTATQRKLNQTSP